MVVQPDSFPFMVVGNKCDLDEKRTINTDEAKKFVSELGDDIDLIETSAKDSVNVEKAFIELARKALKR